MDSVILFVKSPLAVIKGFKIHELNIVISRKRKDFFSFFNFCLACCLLWFARPPSSKSLTLKSYGSVPSAPLAGKMSSKRPRKSESKEKKLFY